MKGLERGFGQFVAIQELCEEIAARLKEKNQVTTIIRRDGGEYLRRGYILQDLLGERSFEDRPSMFLHQFVGDDPYDEVHTHPWEWGVSIILDGAYQETRYDWCKPDVVCKPMPQPGDHRKLTRRRVQTFRQFDVNRIYHNQAHRVMLVGGKPVWTLFIHGNRVSEWGFFKESDGIFRVVKGRTSDPGGNDAATSVLTA